MQFAWAATSASVILILLLSSSCCLFAQNPDQRITADVSNYVQTSVGLALLLVRKTLNCAAFAGGQGGNATKAVCSCACLLSG